MTEEPARDDRAQAFPPLPARIAQVFFSPGALFDRLKVRPAWIGALVTLVVISLLANILVPEELIRQLVMEQLPDDAEPAQVASAMRLAGFFRYVGPVVLTPVLAAAVSGIVLLVWNLILGGEASFGQAMSVTAHTLFIPTLGGLLTIPLMIAANDATVALSLDLLLPGLDEESYAFQFLHGLNFFGLWACVVLGIGVSRLYSKTSARSAALALVSLYVIFKAASAALFG